MEKRKKTIFKKAGILLGCTLIIGVIINIANVKEQKNSNINYSNYLLEELDAEVNNVSNDNTMTFTFVTDLHENNEGNTDKNIQYFTEFTERNKKVEFGAIGGDLYSAYKTNHEQGEYFIKYISKLLKDNTNKKLFFTKGNHECNAKLDKKEYISNEEYYDLAIKDIENEIITNPEDPKGAYYYKDYDDYKVRVCVLNSFEGEGQQFIFNSKELDFIENKMLNFSEKENSSEWQVIFITHTLILEDIDQFNKIINSFQESGGKIIACITGHQHVDTYNLQNGYLEVVVQRGFNKQDEVDTDNEICFSVFTVDLKNRILYENRAGRGENRQWDLEKQEIVMDAA